MTSVSSGKRAGARRGAKPKRGFRPALLLLAVGVTVAVVAWGYLVYAAIDFGTSARGGESSSWWFLGLASVGAVACLFAALMLIARLLRALGITAPPSSRTPQPPKPEHPVGGHRSR